MIGFFLKHGRRILDALLLIAVIVAIFAWNPFDIFGRGLKLQDTANLVANVRAIGQLVTAEYYGEVVASLDEATLNLIEEDSLQERAEDRYVALKRRAFDQYDRIIVDAFDESEIQRDTERVRSALGEAVRATIEEYSREYEAGRRQRGQDSTDVLLLFLAKHVFNENIDEGDYREGKNWQKLAREQLENLFYRVRSEYDAQPWHRFYEFLNQGFETTASYSDFHHDFTRSERSKKEKKKLLAMIGRGWVKAGFDFERLDEQRFSYDRDTRTVHLFGIRAQILDTDINPWFIPQRRVPGFDIVAASKVTFEDAKVVKTYCKRKLVTYALEAEILQQAREYGESAIKEFFTLITGHDVRDVRFHSDELFTVYGQVSKDSLVTIDELPLIDSTYVNYLASIRESQRDPAVKKQKDALLTQFFRDLKELPFEFQGSQIAFNYFIRELQTVLRDSVIDVAEYQKLKNARWRIRPAEWWTVGKDTAAWQIQGDGSLRWKVDPDSLKRKIVAIKPDTAWSRFKKDSLLWHVRQDSLWWKRSHPVFVPQEYAQASHWFDDSLAFVEEYNTLVDALHSLNKGMFALTPDTLRLGTESLGESSDWLEYSVSGDELHVVRIDSVFADSVRTAKLDGLYYDLNVANQALTAAMESDEFRIQERDLRSGRNLRETTSTQKRELQTYHLFVYSQYQLHRGRPWVARASDKFRDQFLNREKIQQVGTSIRRKMRDLVSSF